MLSRTYFIFLLQLLDRTRMRQQTMLPHSIRNRPSPVSTERATRNLSPCHRIGDETHGAAMQFQQPLNVQRHSAFFGRLPQELRDLIYEMVFSSTRLSFGTSRFFCCHHQQYETVCIKQRPDLLGLLRVCKRTRIEIGHTWMRHVLFSFETPRTMLVKLMNLPLELREMIRFVRVRETPGVPFLSKFCLWGIFHLIHGLRLERLTVIGSDFDPSTALLDRFLSFGGGWKELHYICRDAYFLFTTQFGPVRRITETGEGLADDTSSSLSTNLYRSIQPGLVGSMYMEDKRELCGLPHRSVQDLVTELGAGPHNLTIFSDHRREMLLIAKRGATYGPIDDKRTAAAREQMWLDVTKTMGGASMSMREKEKIVVDIVARTESERVTCGVHSVVVDNYGDVDEYTWIEECDDHLTRGSKRQTILRILLTPVVRCIVRLLGPNRVRSWWLHEDQQDKSRRQR
ncbi:hypothetical protein F5Y18DRAFT_378600 [Xylariaceae sp. FL1019]|nr:hypothetical protein F5Y18DRAFT_378600 [Xylariaceae sp. FL1019]